MREHGVVEGRERAVVAGRRPDVARWQSWDTGYGEADARRLVGDQPAGDLPDAGGWLQLAVRSPDRAVLYGDVAVHRLADQPDTYEIGVTLAPGTAAALADLILRDRMSPNLNTFSPARFLGRPRRH